MGRRRRAVPVGVDAPEAPVEPEAPLAPESPTPGEPEPDAEGAEAGLLGGDENALLPDEADALAEADQSVASGQASRELESLELASYNIDRARVWAERADLYRSSPDEYRGVRTAGYIRRWDHPFDAADIESWARKYRGGGRFKIMLYDKTRRLKRIHEFACEGNPVLPGTVPGEEEEAAGFAPPPRPGAPGAPAANTSPDDRVSALEKQLLQQQFQHQLEQQRNASAREQQELREQMRRIEERMAAATAKAAEPPPPPPKPGPSTIEVITAAIAAATPIFTALISNQRDAASRAEKAAQATSETTMKMIERSEHQTAEMLKAVAGRQEKPGEMLDTMMKLKQMSQGSEGMEAKVFTKIIDQALPALINATTRIQMHQAGVRDDGDDEPETFAEKMLGKAGDIMGGFFTSMGQRRAAAPGPYGPPMAPQPQAAPVLPQIPPGPRGGAMIGQMMGAGSSIIMPRGAPPAAAAPAPAAGPMLEAQPAAAAPQPQAAPSAAGPAVPDINEEVLRKALLYMSQGKSGSELADDIMSAEEEREKAAPGAPPLFLSKRVITLLCSQPPAQVLPFILPYIQPMPAYAPLTDGIGLAFLSDFCLYFSAPDDEGVDPITGAPGPGGH